MTSLDFIVVGGGFQGLSAAQLLSASGHRVTIIERSAEVGAVLLSFEEAGLFLDFGCHVFDNSESEITRLNLEILGEDVLPVHIRYCSIMEGRKSDGVAIPDFSDAEPDRRARILAEVIEAAAQPGQDSLEGSLADVLLRRYGPTARAALEPAVRKMTLAGPDELDGALFRKLPFSRIRVAPDMAAELLKTVPALDARLALPSQNSPLRFYPGAAEALPFRNFYPRGNGMRRFCERAQDLLTERGVRFRLGTRVTGIATGPAGVTVACEDGHSVQGHQLIWASDPGELSTLLHGENPLAGLAHRVPLILYYFLVPADCAVGYSYYHDFAPEHAVFRASSPGHYGQQRNADGLTYLCVEVPTPQHSPRWADPESEAARIWEEMREAGMIGLDRPSGLIVRKTPVSFPLSRVGHHAAVERVAQRVADSHPEVLLADGGAFSKVDIVRALRDRLGDWLQ